MLTADLARPRIYHRRGQVKIRTIEKTSRAWQATSAALIQCFSAHQGRNLAEWQDEVEALIGDSTDYVIIRGLAKVLYDNASWSSPEAAIPPDELRHFLFANGPVFDNHDFLHPRVRSDFIAEAAQRWNVSPAAVEADLFADRSAELLLTDVGEPWNAEELIARYNLELARAALYWSDQMTVHVHDTFKDFWKYIKLFKLMFEATPLDGGGYEVKLDGPISPFVKSTTRYGRQLAAFLPALFLCEKWRMWASIQLPRVDKPLTYQLDDKTVHSSHFTSSGEFDSRMEADFAREFEEKFGDERGKWVMTREDEVILLGDTVMIPDFTFTHKKDGRRAIMEIVGFWHPDYLERKVKKVQAAQRRDMFLLVYEGVNLTREKLGNVPSEVLYFKNKPVLKDVMALLERVAIEPEAPSVPGEQAESDGVGSADEPHDVGIPGDIVF